MEVNYVRYQQCNLETSWQQTIFRSDGAEMHNDNDLCAARNRLQILAGQGQRVPDQIPETLPVDKLASE